MKRFLKPEYFIYLAILFSSAVFLILNAEREDSLSLVLANLKFAGITERNFLFILFYAPFLIGMARAGRFFLRLILKDSGKGNPFEHLNVSFLWKSFTESLKNFLFLGVPLIIALYALGFALGALSVARADALVDGLLMNADKALTGTYPFLFFGNILYPAWFVVLVDWFYLYLGIVLLGFAVYLFAEKRKLFKECAGAFFFGMILMFFLWWMFPALTPRQRFVDNVYRLPVSLQVELALSSYHPQKEIVSFFDKLREEEKNLSVFVVSTMPSAHIAWAVLFVYYVYRALPAFLVVVIPFALLSSFGTLLFAQHYFIDIPSGLLVGILSIAVARYFAKVSADMNA